MFCPNCGAQLSDGVKFCRKCGYRIQPQPQAQQQQYQQPQQQYQQPQYQPQYQQAARTAATGAAKKAGGGLLKKIVIAALVVTVGGVAISVVSEIFSGGGGGEPSSGGNGNISVSTNGNGDSTTAESASFSIPKSTYSPGETITVTYKSIPDKMISNGAWIGMAGASNGPMEHLNKEPVTKNSGTISMRAPSAPGQYQVRFFKAQDATADNLVATLGFTVKSASTQRLCEDFSLDLYDYSAREYTLDSSGNLWPSQPNASIEVRDDKIRIEMDAIDTEQNTPGGVDADGEVLLSMGFALRRDAYTLSGEITSAVERKYYTGETIKEYRGTINSFDAFDYYSRQSTGGMVTMYDVHISPLSSMPSEFILRVSTGDDAHAQIWITLSGNKKGVEISDATSWKEKEVDESGEIEFRRLCEYGNDFDSRWQMDDYYVND